MRSAVLSSPTALATPLVRLQPVFADPYILWPIRPVGQPIPEPIRSMVDAAIRAPSRHNCQPWQFLYDGKRLAVALDTRRSAGTIDIGRRSSLIAVGAAIESMRIAAAAQGYRVVPVAQADPSPGIVAILDVVRDSALPGSPLAALYPAVASRVTNRRPGNGRAIPWRELRALATATQAFGIKFDMLTAPASLRAFAEVAGIAERAQVLSPALLGPLMDAVRWGAPTHPDRPVCDGIPVSALPPATAAALRLMSRPDLLPYPEIGEALEASTRDLIKTSAAVALISAPLGGPDGALAEGRALARLWLEATTRGIAVQPIAPAPCLFALLDIEPTPISMPCERNRLARAREMYRTLFPGAPNRSPGLLLRLFYPEGPAASSPRRPIGDVLHHTAAIA